VVEQVSAMPIAKGTAQREMFTVLVAELGAIRTVVHGLLERGWFSFIVAIGLRNDIFFLSEAPLDDLLGPKGPKDGDSVMGQFPAVIPRSFMVTA